MKNVKKTGLFYLFAAFFNKGIAFLTIPIFTKILSPSDYGVINTFNSLVEILSVVLSVSLFMSVRSSFIDFPEKKEEFLSNVITFLLLSTTATLVLVLLFSEFIDRGILYLCFLCIGQAFSSAVLLDYTQFLMMEYKYRYRTFLLVSPNIIAIVVSILSILYLFDGKKYYGRIVPTAFVFFLFSIYVIIRVYQKSPPCINTKLLRYGLAISAPLVFHGIALNMLAQFDRTMISYFADTAQTGIYSLVYNFSMIAMVITVALDGVWLPWFIDNLKKKEYSIINIYAENYAKLLSFVIGMLILIGPELLRLISDERYWSGIKILPILMVSNYIVFAYTLYVNVEHFHKKTVSLTVFTLISLAVNLGLNYIFIPLYGYVAAALTTLTAYIVCFLLHMRFSRKIENLILPLTILKWPVVEIILIIVIYYAAIENPVVRWGASIVYMLLYLYREQDTLLRFVASFRQRKGT